MNNIYNYYINDNNKQLDRLLYFSSNYATVTIKNSIIKNFIFSSFGIGFYCFDLDFTSYSEKTDQQHMP